MRKSSNRLIYNRAGRNDLASAQRKLFKKPSFPGGFLLGLILIFCAVPAAAQESSATPTTAEDRARFLQMLKEINLPPVVSYNQAPSMSSAAVNYGQTPPLLPGMSLPLRQHDVEETPRKQ